MSIICNTDYTTAQKYCGKNLSTKYNNKKHRVYLKLLCDDTNLAECIDLARRSKNILMVSYQGAGSWSEYEAVARNSGVYVGYAMDFGADVTLDDISRAIKDVPDWVTPIINLPQSFCDMELLWRVSREFRRVRFSGGQLFSLDGVKVGEIGIDILQGAEVKFGADSYRIKSGVDALENVDIGGLEIDASGRVESIGTKKPKVSGGSNARKNSESIRSRIGSLFLSSEMEGF